MFLLFSIVLGLDIIIADLFIFQNLTEKEVERVSLLASIVLCYKQCEYDRMFFVEWQSVHCWTLSIHFVHVRRETVQYSNCIPTYAYM